VQVIQAYAVFAAQENMEKLLKEQGMWDLYRNVEIPLVFTLRQMEADGIAAEKEALSVYGADLAERIGELEYCDFNGFNKYAAIPASNRWASSASGISFRNSFPSMTQKTGICFCSSVNFS